jgi:DNA (cytosine-5)-methyltransferase 1
MDWKTLDVCAGIGAFSKAAKSIDAKVVAQIEIDKNCNKLLAKHHPEALRLGDIHDVKKESINEPIDIIAGGTPCQQLSIAGNGKGLAGEESQLWFEYLRLATELKPRWLVWENVPNALYTNGGADFLTILRGLDECGYHVAWRVLDAQYFGVPQRRRRIFLVASLGDGRAAKVLFERESLPGTHTARPRAWKASPVAGTLAGSASGTARPAGQANELDFLVFGKQRSNDFIEGASVASTLASRDHKDFSDLVAMKAKRNERLDPAFLDEKGNVLGFNPSHYMRGFGSSLHNADTANTLQANVGRGFSETDEHIIMSFSPATYKRDVENKPLRPTDIASTIRAHKKNFGDTTEQLVTNGLIRRFTPLECERLQGFPDGHTEGFSDTVRYSMLGNSIALPVAKWIFERIKAVDVELLASREAA